MRNRDTKIGVRVKFRIKNEAEFLDAELRAKTQCGWTHQFYDIIRDDMVGVIKGYTTLGGVYVIFPNGTYSVPHTALEVVNEVVKDTNANASSPKSKKTISSVKQTIEDLTKKLEEASRELSSLMEADIEQNIVPGAVFKTNHGDYGLIIETWDGNYLVGGCDGILYKLFSDGEITKEDLIKMLVDEGAIFVRNINTKEE